MVWCVEERIVMYRSGKEWQERKGFARHGKDRLGTLWKGMAGWVSCGQLWIGSLMQGMVTQAR